MPASTLKDRLTELIVPMGRGAQRRLARACGVDPASVNNWLSGKTRSVEGANLLAAARFFGVNPEWLATGRGSREPLNFGDGGVRGALGQTVTIVTPPPSSQPAILDPLILVEAEKWVAFEEGAAGKTYALLPRAERLSALYTLILADGGTLSPANAATLIEAARERPTTGERGSVGSSREGHRASR